VDVNWQKHGVTSNNEKNVFETRLKNTVFCVFESYENIDIASLSAGWFLLLHYRIQKLLSCRLTLNSFVPI
jgi:hypothetical protein